MNRALLAAAATGVQVGLALVASQAIVAEVGAGRLGFLRYAIGLLFLLPFAGRANTPPILRRDLLPVSLIGFVGLSSGLGYLAWLYALSDAPAGIVTAFLALSPITAMLVSVLLLNAQIAAAMFGAVTLIIGGLAVMALASKTAKPDGATGRMSRD